MKTTEVTPAVEVASVFTKKLVSVNENENLGQADDLMNNYNIRHLPVVDNDDFLVGIISKTDFIALKYIDSRLKNFRIKDFMTSPVKVVQKSTKIKDVANLFINHKISSVLVADQGEVVGILTSEDLLKLLARNMDFMGAVEELDLKAMYEEGWL